MASSPSFLWEGTLVALGVFVVVHLSLLAAQDTDEFLLYAKIAELATHLFAVPAILRSRHMREQILITVIVSLVFHSIDSFFEDVNPVPYQRLDLAMSTALISTVFLKFLCRTEHVMGIIVLFAGVAASFEFGNMISVGITGTVLILILTFPCLDQAAYKVVNWLVFVLTFGGKAPPKSELKLKDFRGKLSLAFFAQLLSVVFFFVGRASDGLARWSHGFWHTFAFLALFVLVDVVALREDEERKLRRTKKLARPSRTSYKLLG